ncbi:hypothetical protein NQU17_10900 [Clostridiaceae bacterium HFYG-1003]|nr:hypothetical protein NQU17_10900 [Clostridiaceae bacterium HFYG-1003]
MFQSVLMVLRFSFVSVVSDCFVGSDDSGGSTGTAGTEVCGNSGDPFGSDGSAEKHLGFSLRKE